MEMADLNDTSMPLKNDQDNIYQMGKLKRRLQE